MTLNELDGTTTSSLRLINARAVLRELRSVSTFATVGELAKATGLTRPTIDGALDELAQLDLAEEAASPTSARSAGRPARRFRFRAEAGLAVGVDLRPDRVRVEVVDLSGRTVGRSFHSGKRLANPSDATDAAADEIERVIEDFELDATLLQAVSMSVPGVVDSTGTLWKSVVVPEWVRADLPAALSARLPGDPVVLIDNAANHAALSEPLAAASADSMVFVLVDEGIGAGVILNHTLVRGNRGGAGEVGAIDELRWRTASDRLLQHVASLDAIRDYATATGDAQAAMQQFAADIAIGTAALVLAYDPQLVVIGGVVVLADDTFLGLIQSELDRRCLYPPRLVRATFGEDAVVRGASLQALSAIEHRRFP